MVPRVTVQRVTSSVTRLWALEGSEISGGGSISSLVSQLTSSSTMTEPQAMYATDEVGIHILTRLSLMI